MHTVSKWILSKLLHLIDPHKPLGTSLFDAIARVSVSVAFEAVALRKNSETGGIEVYMTQRPENDTAYPGQWHVPGSVLRPNEDDEHVLHRLSKREFHTKIVKSKFVGMMSNPGEERGHFLSLIYRVKLEDEPSGGEWFSINRLPVPTVKEHKEYIIPIAARAAKFRDIEESRVKVVES